MTAPFDPARLLRTLQTSKAEFVLIGGLALVSRGIVRPTGDLDICYATDKENRARLVKALAPLHPQPRTEDTSAGALLQQTFRWDLRTMRFTPNLTLLTDAGPLDLLAHVDGLGTYSQVRAASSSQELYGAQLLVLDLEGLLIAKRAAGRPKDLAVLADIEALIRIRDQERGTFGQDSPLLDTQQF
jgi:hypothetical protein